MKEETVKKFYAISFDDMVYEIIVKDNKKMIIPQINENEIDSIILKPRMQIIYSDGKKGLLSYEKNRQFLIQKYQIEDCLFDYLKENDLIKYSSQTAYYYNFKDKEGYDFKKCGSLFKKAKNKGLILVKQKMGLFN